MKDAEAKIMDNRWEAEALCRVLLTIEAKNCPLKTT